MSYPKERFNLEPNPYIDYGSCFDDTWNSVLPRGEIARAEGKTLFSTDSKVPRTKAMSSVPPAGEESSPISSLVKKALAGNRIRDYATVGLSVDGPARSVTFNKWILITLVVAIVLGLIFGRALLVLGILCLTMVICYVNM